MCAFNREDEDSILAHQYQKEEMHENAQELEDEVPFYCQEHIVGKVAGLTVRLSF